MAFEDIKALIAAPAAAAPPEVIIPGTDASLSRPNPLSLRETERSFPNFRTPEDDSASEPAVDHGAKLHEKLDADPELEEILKHLSILAVQKHLNSRQP